MVAPVRIGVTVALVEEFRELRQTLPIKPQVEEYDGQTYYRIGYSSIDKKQTYDIFITFIGGMGNDKSALFTDRLITYSKPELVVMLGIAGAVHGDLKLGDVVVATQVDKFIDAGKAVSGGPFCIEFGGEVYRATDWLLNKIQNFEFKNEELFLRWQEGCRKRLVRELKRDSLAKLTAAGVIGEKVDLSQVHLGASPVVVSSKEFGSWLHQRDRNIKAVDMESGGVMLAAHSRVEPTQTLVLRGISDLADSRKSQMDAIGQGSIRRCAMQNATSFMLTLLDAGLIAAPRSLSPAPADAVGASDSRSRKIREFLYAALPTDSDFEAFCQDYFQNVRRKFGPDMNRDTKITILFSAVSADDILLALRQADTQKYATCEHILK